MPEEPLGSGFYNPEPIHKIEPQTKANYPDEIYKIKQLREISILK